MPLSSKKLQSSVDLKSMSMDFSYDPLTGFVTNKKTNHTYTKESRNGYLCLGYQRKSFLVHRVAWMLHHGYWPEFEIDHANGIKSDNRISNLRAASRSQNVQNTNLRKDNTTGYKGITWSKLHQKYRARISNGGERLHLGLYDSVEGAAVAIRSKRKQIHGEFCNHGQPES